MWIVAAIFSAVFAGLTAILSKCGVRHANSDVATAVRTSVVLVMAWVIVFITGAYSTLPEISGRSWLFLILSGFATGASWICYFKALSLGEVSKVAAVDKSSAVLSVLFAIILFRRARAMVAEADIPRRDSCRHVPDDRYKARRGQGKTHLADIRHTFGGVRGRNLSACQSRHRERGFQCRHGDTQMRGAHNGRLIVFCRGETKYVKELKGKEWLFLILSGLATGASWLCYYYVIQQGQVSIVVPIDKLSILITVLFSLVVFKEKLNLKEWIGLALLTAGTVLMAVFT